MGLCTKLALCAIVLACRPALVAARPARPSVLQNTEDVLICGKTRVSGSSDSNDMSKPELISSFAVKAKGRDTVASLCQTDVMDRYEEADDKAHGMWSTPLISVQCRLHTALQNRGDPLHTFPVMREL
jgi:hypothetical protein